MGVADGGGDVRRRRPDGHLDLPPARSAAPKSAEVLRIRPTPTAARVTFGLLQALAFVLLAFRFVYLFRRRGPAASGCAAQLIGLIIAAPLFLGSLAGLSGRGQQKPRTSSSPAKRSRRSRRRKRRKNARPT